jgi:hypothetical protein
VFSCVEKPLSFQNKLVRKYFYENSQFVDDILIFAELQNNRIGSKIGVSSKD